MTVTVNRGGLDIRDADGALVLRWAGGTNRRAQTDLWHYAVRRGWTDVAAQLSV